MARTVWSTNGANRLEHEWRERGEWREGGLLFRGGSCSFVPFVVQRKGFGSAFYGTRNLSRRPSDVKACTHWRASR